MEFLQKFDAYREMFNTYAKHTFVCREGTPRELYEAMAYSFFAGGKRIRPVILLASYSLFHQDCTAALPFALALEQIHTYSLIHDDLPAMDNDDLRRGRPTCHKVYGEALALLAGDGLLNSAFETASTAISEDTANPLNGVRALALLAQAAGSSGMIGGQVLDMAYESRAANAREMEQMYAQKTGALLYTASTAGAILAGASETDISKLKQYGTLLGVAFQIKDDMLDVTGSAAELGKNPGSDDKNHKSTYVSVYGLEKCKALLSQYTERAVEKVSGIEGSGFLCELARYMENREN